MHNRTDPSVRIAGGSRQPPERTPAAAISMWPVIGVVVAIAVALLVQWFRLPGGVDESNLGQMSAEWLAQRRAADCS